MANKNDFIHSKYCDTLTHYHTCPKIQKSILLPIQVSKDSILVANSVDPDQMPPKWHLIWVYTV